MKIKVYNVVYKLLKDHPKLRDSDKLLIWTVWGMQGLLLSIYVHGTTIITRDGFLSGASPESIRRCRQKIQAKYPELRSSKEVQKAKDEIAKEKGTHVFREEV